MNYFDNFPAKPKAKKGIPNLKMNAPLFTGPLAEGDVGIEFEIESTNRNLPWGKPEINAGDIKCGKTGAVWAAKEDNSLRDGAEYVTTGPVAIESVPGLVTGLYNNLKKYGAKLRFSNRCSTHVHLNATTYKIHNLVTFYCLWALFEEVLVSWCGPKRKTNHFCLSNTDTQYSIDQMHEFIKTGKWNFGEGAKYTALNLLRLRDLGTLEVRCGDAWEDPNRMIEWIKFLHALKQFSDTIESPDRLPGIVSEYQPKNLFVDICEKAGTPLIRDELLSMYHESFDRTCYSGFRDTLGLCSTPPWAEWMEAVNAEYVPNPFAKSKSKIAFR